MSRSSRCTRRGLSGRSNLSASARPSRWRRWPEPPCTASPGGLLSAMTSSSRQITQARISSASASETRGGGLGRRRAVLGDRRHAHVCPASSRVAGLRPAAVDADLALAAHALDAALGDLREAAAQPAVQPLVRLVGADGDLLDAAHGPFEARSAGLVKSGRPRPAAASPGDGVKRRFGGGGKRRGLGGAPR